MNNDLISREALRNEVDSWGCNDYDKYDFLEAIDNAPAVDTFTFDDMKTGLDVGYSWGYSTGKCQRPQGDCEKCDYRKFTETFIDGIVDLMSKNGITSIEQLSEILKGGKE